MKISVILVSNLSFYEGAPANQQDLFLRSVKSFLNGICEGKHLYVIANGCTATYDLCRKHFSDSHNIDFFYQEKRLSVQETRCSFIDQMRHNKILEGIITYMEPYDLLGPTHLHNIKKQ